MGPGFPAMFTAENLPDGPRVFFAGNFSEGPAVAADGTRSDRCLLTEHAQPPACPRLLRTGGSRLAGTVLRHGALSRDRSHVMSSAAPLTLATGGAQNSAATPREPGAAGSTG